MKAEKITKETINFIDLPNRDFPSFNPGDTINVGLKIKEGTKIRTQLFEGIVIGIKGAGISKTFRIRKISSASVAVERIFQYYSPLITKINVVKRGIVRRAKLYYLRDRKGKKAEVKTKKNEKRSL
jgi:large subunit ribosomal protein L19